MNDALGHLNSCVFFTSGIDVYGVAHSDRRPTVVGV